MLICSKPQRMCEEMMLGNCISVHEFAFAVSYHLVKMSPASHISIFHTVL